ncbi:MAG TPA: A/G-specific adenine glycosylase, partial [Candidatus Faecivivens stercoravium]|nr:A/G-specific adenine glycosylase [Candidatus Faecivivens stercoravium]
MTEAESLSRLRGAAEALGDWYKENARHLPWREREPQESYPYRVWVSE